MRIVFAASEATPFAKTGGLGDVAGALPLALAKLKHHIDVFLPLYAGVSDRVTWLGKPVEVVAEVSRRPVPGQVRKAAIEEPNVRIFFLDQPEFFDRPGLYTAENGQDYSDNCARFTWFCRAIFSAIEAMQLKVDCLHAHDWQTALVPVLLAHDYRRWPSFAKVASIFTIHNLAFQGIFDHSQWRVTGLSDDLFSLRGLEFYGKFSLLKGGVLFADHVTTVSRTYAEEIKGREFGHGMEGVLQSRAGELTGIVNGIDYTLWNPATDVHLAANYDEHSWRQGKRQCKTWLQQKLRLDVSETTPLVGFVGRLTEQKGLDLIERIGRQLLDKVQLVVLGSGGRTYEEFLRELAREYPHRCAAVIGFDEELARQIYAGADMFLMPSRFEPCGLSQLYSLRYGTLPIVRAVGGLIDTVVDANPNNLRAGTATGFHFDQYTPTALLHCIDRALQAFEDHQVWGKMVNHAMTRDWSWEKSAREYSRLYERVLQLRRMDRSASRGWNG